MKTAISAVLVWLWLICSPAQGACRASAGYSLPYIPRISLGPAPLIDPRIADWERLGSITLSYDYTAQPEVVCSSDVGWQTPIQGGVQRSVSIWSTGIAGIGYSLEAPDIEGDLYHPGRSFKYRQSTEGQLHLWKTGTIVSAGVLTGLSRVDVLRDHDNTAVRRIDIPDITLHLLPRPTCELMQRVGHVDFGQVSRRSTLGVLAEKVFEVGVHCAGGSDNRSTPVNITYHDAENPTNRTTQLRVTPADRGLAIEFFQDQTPISFGDERLLGTLDNGRYRYPVTARLVSTCATGTAGRFEARATVTLSHE